MKIVICSLIFCFAASASDLKIQSLNFTEKSNSLIPPIRFVTGKYALIKNVLSQDSQGLWQSTETTVCQGLTTIPVSDSEPNGGEILADVLECPTTTNGEVVTARIVSLVLFGLKSHLFPGEGPIRVRDNVLLLFLKAQNQQSTGTPYGFNVVSTRQEFSSVINSIFSSPAGTCGLAPLPTCGEPTIESFRLNMEFGQ